MLSVGAYCSIRHRQPREELATAITRLAMHQPAGIDEEEWVIFKDWTWNLHSNYGGMGFAPASGLQRLARQLNSRINGGADLATIDSVWDQYIEMYPPSAAYEKWRPTSQNREAYLTGGEALGGTSLSYWQSENRRRSGSDELEVV